MLEVFPIVAILGPRQAGKTTLAHVFAQEVGSNALYLDLELPSDRAKMEDAETFLSRHQTRLVILDEIQRLPDVFSVLRGLSDRTKREGRHAGHFLILGSASIDLLRQASESLAGRLVTTELTPFLASEVGMSDDLWNRGGFPSSYLAKSDSDSFLWRVAFISTYLERDVPALGPRIPATTLYRLWQMLAHSQGQLLNVSRLAASLGVSGQTVARYIDLMCDLFLVRRLPPFLPNLNKRLVRAPKTFVRDSGLVHALLGIQTTDQLLGHPVAGASWEGLIVENIIAALPVGARASFYRTASGAEIDLVLELGALGIWAIEIKRSSTPKLERGFYAGCEDVGAGRRMAVYPGTERFKNQMGVEILPLPDLIQDLGNLAR